MEPPEELNTSQSFIMPNDWPVQSKLLKDKFMELTDADLAFIEGEEEALLARIGERLHMQREEVINIIKKGILFES